MGVVQKLLTAVLPQKSARAMEAESRSWMVRCPCGHAQSIWDMGGVRWKAAGEPRRYLKCAKCGERTWHTITREAS